MAALMVTAPGWKRYSGQMSSVPPARSTRVGAFDSMRKGDPLALESFSMSAPRKHTSSAATRKRKRTGKCLRWKLRPAGTAPAFGRLISGRAGHPRTRDQVRTIFLLVCQGRIRLKAAPATRFIRARRAHDDQFLAFHQPLRVHRRIAAAHADGKQFGDLLGDSEQSRHRLKRPPAVIRVQPGDNHALAQIGQLRANVNDFVAQELRFIDPDNLGSRLNLLHDFAGLRHVVGWNPESRVRDDFIHRVALVNGWLEDLHALAGDFRAPKPPNQLLALAGKHRPDHHFDPAHIPFDDVHTTLLPLQAVYSHNCSFNFGPGPPLRCRTFSHYRTAQTPRRPLRETPPAS